MKSKKGPVFVVESESELILTISSLEEPVVQIQKLMFGRYAVYITMKGIRSVLDDSRSNMFVLTKNSSEGASPKSVKKQKRSSAGK